LDGTEDEEHWETFHSKAISSMRFKDMDPSCAMAFLIQNNSELEKLVGFLEKNGIADIQGISTNNSLFSIVYERPVYDPSLMTNETTDHDTGFEVI
jgi:hypothetical protein